MGYVERERTSESVDLLGEGRRLKQAETLGHVGATHDVHLDVRRERDGGLHTAGRIPESACLFATASRETRRRDFEVGV